MVFAVAMSACGGGGDGIVKVPPTKQAALTAVQVSPPSQSVQVGQTGTVQASLVGPGASTGQGATTFQISPTSVATISAGGIVTGVAPGTATVTVTGTHPSTETLNASTVSATAQVTVTALPNALTDVVLSPTSPSVVTGKTLQLQVTFTKAGPAVATSCTYLSGSTSVANVSGSGLVTGVSVGSSVITVTCNGTGAGFTANTLVRTITVAVTAPPVASIELTAPVTYLQPGPGTDRVSTTIAVVTKDADGNVLTGRTVTWVSSLTAVATVNGSGVVNAVDVGTTNITATSEGVNRAIAINVVRAFGAVNADQPTTSTYISGINSAGQTNVITRTAVGRYTITFNDIGLGAIGRQFMFMVNAKSSATNAALAAPTAVCNVENGFSNAPVRLDIRCEDPFTFVNKDAEFRAMVIGDFALAGSSAFTTHIIGNTTVPYAPNSIFSFNSALSPMTITPNAVPGSFNNVLTRHSQGVTVPSQMSFAQVITSLPGRTCHTRNQFLGSLFTDILCYERTSTTVDATHQVLRLSAGRAGSVYGTAFLDANNGASSGQGFASTGSVQTVRTGNGKYTITFTGLVPANAPFGVIASPWSSNDWLHCAHFVAAVNPLTIDVACFNKNGIFSNFETSAIQLLVLQ